MVFFPLALLFIVETNTQIIQLRIFSAGILHIKKSRNTSLSIRSHCFQCDANRFCKSEKVNNHILHHRHKKNTQTKNNHLFDRTTIISSFRNDYLISANLFPRQNSDANRFNFFF